MLIGALALGVLFVAVWSEQFSMGDVGLIGSILLAISVAAWLERVPARCPHYHLIEWCGSCQATKLRTVNSFSDVLHADDPDRRKLPRVA
jgi:hypothetical protein